MGHIGIEVAPAHSEGNMARYSIRPSRGISVITGILGLILGILVLVYFGTTGGSTLLLVFVGLWLLVCIALISYHVDNALTGNAPPIRDARLRDK
jgi:hypothetical protein